jgi:hypothetical protein
MEAPCTNREVGVRHRFRLTAMGSIWWLAAMEIAQSMVAAVGCILAAKVNVTNPGSLKFKHK